MLPLRVLDLDAALQAIVANSLLLREDLDEALELETTPFSSAKTTVAASRLFLSSLRNCLKMVSGESRESSDPSVLMKPRTRPFLI